MKKIEIEQTEEYWLVINVGSPTSINYQLCFEVAYKLLNELEFKSKELHDFNLESFHYFFEEKFVIRIEVGNSEQIQQAKEICMNSIDVSKIGSIEYIENYKGEWQYRDDELVGYGAAWPVVKKFFEASCRFKLSTLFHEFILGEANIGKLIHCFINQQGTDLYNEMLVQLNLFWRRLGNNILIDDRRDFVSKFVNNTRDLPSTLNELYSAIQDEKFDKAKKIMRKKEKKD